MAATSIEDIRAASGASNGSIYHHFGSKERIAASLYAEAMADYQRGVRAVIATAETAEAGIRGIVEQFLVWVGEHRELAILMLALEHGDVRRVAAEEVAALNAGFFADVGGWIERHVAAGDLPAVPRDLLMPVVLGPARRFAELWLEGRARTPIDEAARVLAALAWDGLGGHGR